MTISFDKLPYTKSRTLVDMISDDSDEDLFASTPQKSPPKKTWRQKRVSVPTEESETGSGDAPETEIDSTLLVLIDFCPV